MKLVNVKTWGWLWIVGSGSGSGLGYRAFQFVNKLGINDIGVEAQDVKLEIWKRQGQIAVVDLRMSLE